MGGRKFTNKVGNTYGRLIVLSLVEKSPLAKWLCACECGNKKVIYGAHLVDGGTQSCGCLNKEITSKRVKTHGLTKSKTYISWHCMKNRCTNPNAANWKNYGGKGLTFDDSWQDFNKFLLDMGERPNKTTLDRINNNLGYSKENCRWATPNEQQSNRSCTLWIEYNGEIKTAKEWATHLGLAPGAVWNRIKLLGWDIEKAVTTRKNG